MKESEIKKEILEDVTPVNEENIEFSNETPQANETETDPAQLAEQQPAVNLMDFGNVITNVYCNVSDMVYKRIKHTDTPPVWDDSTKQAINESLKAYLSTVNIVVKPLYGLIATLATIEVIRYAQPVKRIEE